jgi:hypothetical protein
MSDPIGPTGPSGDDTASATGPTGVEQVVVSATGPTGVEAPVVSATGPSPYPFPMIPIPTATGPTGPSYIATIDQLVTQHSLALQQEATDRAALRPLISPTSYGYTPALQAWASEGFPPLGTLVTITLNPPSPCSDGTTRTVYEYVSYLNGGIDLGAATVALDAQFLGITIAYVLQGNTVRICASRE